MKQKMSQFILCLLLALFCMIQQDVSRADELWVQYDISEIGVSISLPDSFDVFRRNMPTDSPLFSVYGMSAQEIDAMLVSQNRYLDAVSANGMNEVFVTMIGSSLDNFNDWDSDLLMQMASLMPEYYKSNGTIIDKYDVYRSSDATFIRLWQHIENDAETCALQYYTVCDYQAVNITLLSYEGKLDGNEEALMQDIACKAVFNKENEIKSQYDDELAMGTLYTDKISGTTFTIPNGWEEVSLYKQRNYIEAKFAPKDETMVNVVFTSTDAWNAMGSSDRMVWEQWGLNRSDMNNSIASIDDVADWFGMEKKTIEMKTYGGQEFFVLTAEAESEFVSKFQLSMPIKYFVCINNGYMYVFQFAGIEDGDKYFKEFERLLAGIAFSQY